MKTSIGHVALLAATAAVLFYARADLLDGAPFAPFYAQSGHQGALLLLRVALLFLTLDSDARMRRGPVVPAAIAALFAVSLAASGLVLPFVVACLWLLRGADLAASLGLDALSPPRRRSAALAAAAASGAALAGAVAGAALGPREPPASRGIEAAADPAAETLRWLERDNLFRARHAALSWARLERTPGEGALVLARLSWELGHRDEARRRARVVLDHGSAETARKAERLLSGWASGGVAR